MFIGGRPSRRPTPALLAAVGTGLAIATYTVVDGVAAHKIDLATYMAWVFMLQGLGRPLAVLFWHGPTFLQQEKRHLYAGLGGGLVSLAAYGLVLWAQQCGTLASIAALRETSIIFGAIIGALFGPKRAIAAAVVVAGIVLISSG